MEVEALLDFRGGMEEYHRDDAERSFIVNQFRFNLRRITTMAIQAGVPIILMNPVCNLGDCPPFKSEHSRDLSPSQLREWQSLCDQAAGRLRGSNPDAATAARLYEEACKLDPLYAGGYYNLAKCYEALRDFPRAKETFLKAKELDVCPLRVLEAMNDAVSAVAHETGAPLVDAKALFEQRSSHEIVGGDWLVDHVHPNFEGHKLLADALVGRMTEMGLVHPHADWELQKAQAWKKHFASLGDYYFLRGESRLERLRGWAHGRAKRLRQPADVAPDEKQNVK
jgi:tetratricopeptide (TPR) repeat protein